MKLILRRPTENDWDSVLEAADATVIWDPKGNREWLRNRQQFTGTRRHYLVTDSDTNAVLGYGALEEEPHKGTFRLFVVMPPQHIEGETGTMLYNQLAADLTELNAYSAWVREYAADTATLNFFAQRGFVETNRVNIPGKPEMVIMEKNLRKRTKPLGRRS
jgi:N-acetylglutamate synthase-like GNAT family acetyltransferase